MAQFRELLKNRNFFLLWIGQIISQFGDRLNQMALIALIYSRFPGSALQLAKVLSFTIIPVFVVGPVAASYVDRWDRRRTMVFCELCRAALVAAIALFFIDSQSIWPIYIIIFLVFSVGRFFVPAKMVLIPQLVSEKKLLLANSLSSTTGMIAAVGGFVAGGLIVEHIGSSGGFLLDAASYLVSGALILMIVTKTINPFQEERLTKAPKDLKKVLRQTLFVDMKEGWQYMLNDKDVRFVAQILFLLGSAVGAVYVIAIVFVQQALGSATRDLAVLAMFLGLGLFCGSMIYGRFGELTSRMKAIFASLATSGVILAIFAISLRTFPSVILACGIIFALGLTASPIIISSYTLIHEVTKERLRGRIFGSLEIVMHLGFLLFMFLSSFVAERVGRFWILLFVGITLAIIGTGAIALKMDRKRG